MRTPCPHAGRLLLVLLAAPFGGARAEVPIVDGKLDAAYGPAIVTQTAQTEHDDTSGVVDASDGWELDEAYGLIRDGVLYLMFTGNIELAANNIEPGTYSTPLDVFIDSVPGGQNVVQTPGGTAPPLQSVAGLRFDAGFSADYWVGFYGSGGPDDAAPYNLQTYYAVLPSSAPDTTSFVGIVSPVNAGVPLYGSNSHGIQLAVDNSNRAGVGEGCGSGSGAGAQTGIELAIPLEAIGSPTGEVRICAFLSNASWSLISNQVLGAVQPGSCPLGFASAVDFSALPGAQYFVVSPDELDAPSAVGAALAIRAVSNGAPGLTVNFSLPTAAPARLDVMDAAGRRVLARSIETRGGQHTVTIAAPGELPAGVFFLQLQQGARTAKTRAVVIR